jgi:hypothetical protein
MAEKTFLITEGKVKANNLEDGAENLHFAIEEGYSDQDIISAFDDVKFWGEKIKKELELKRVV